jgi:hypothetical protein
MRIFSAVLASFALIANARRTKSSDNTVQPQEFFLSVPTDHFDAMGKSDEFMMRYLVDDTYWDPETGPLLFYSGNEGDIYSFYDNAGFMTKTVAEETKGLIVFGEHRYFGVSYPFPPADAFFPWNNKYLTVEQAMEDFVDLVKFIREDYDMEDKACVTFGGSYGGMLSAWLRQKYP